MGSHKGQDKELSIKFRQPSVPEEKKKKDKGHVKIYPIPTWGNVRCVAS